MARALGVVVVNGIHLLLLGGAYRRCIEIERLLDFVSGRGDASWHMDLRRVAIKVVDAGQDLGILVGHTFLASMLGVLGDAVALEGLAGLLRGASGERRVMIYGVAAASSTFLVV